MDYCKLLNFRVELLDSELLINLLDDCVRLEADMRAEGKIIKRDFMNQEDREWLEKDIEDTVHFANGTYEVPFYENNEWIRQFGKKP